MLVKLNHHPDSRFEALMKFRSLALPTILVLALPLLAACGGDDATPTPSGPLTTLVNVELDEWSVVPVVTQVGSGTTNFNVRNVGALEHELVLFKTDLGIDELPMTAAGTVDETAGTIIGEIEPDELQPGDQASATFELGSSTYVLLCNIPGHYQAGMRAVFFITN
jgi:hypothetical protein